MMYDSPIALQELCVNYICDNLFQLCEYSSKDEPELASTTCDLTSLSNSKAVKICFRNGDIFLHSEISERLFEALCSKEKLTDYTVSLFDSKTTRLCKVTIPKASKLSKEGLKILKGHKIVELVAYGLKFSVNDLLSCLGDWTWQNLRSLNVSGGTFLDDCYRHRVIIGLSMLKNLRHLNVSNTDFNRHSLEMVVEDLPALESLDISGTRVDDISPLRKCRKRLKSLAMYNLKFIKVNTYEEVLLDLKELQFLDISEERDSQAFEMLVIGAPNLGFLDDPTTLPNLVSLDLSGRVEVERRKLKFWAMEHTNLKYLGLVHLDACVDGIFTNPKDPDYNKELKVSGTANEEQLLLALKKYPNRGLYVQKCLYNVFRLTQYYTEVRTDVIELVLQGMDHHPHGFSIQMAATACLYNLTKGELSPKIHPKLLAKVVSSCLTAMKNFPTHFQLQKNALLTLCSDRILQEVPIDKYLCAKLVLDCLCAFEETAMNRMCVAICSILAAKISTSETSVLGSQPNYMRKLLRLVKAKKDARVVDVTLKFTLSALWNLTDESPNTCLVFIEEGGLDLFLEVLQTFPGESAVETKVLGLVNNIAEVADLRHCLLKPSFIGTLKFLLHSSQIEVSYFAAGILAHLAVEGPAAWQNCDVPRDVVLEELGNAVSNWTPPEGEMVAYRSFHPFISLLVCKEAPQVQLWAVWAIHHVCTKNPQRYCLMLEAEEGCLILNFISQYPYFDERVRNICCKIMDLLRTYGTVGQQTLPVPERLQTL